MRVVQVIASFDVTLCLNWISLLQMPIAIDTFQASPPHLQIALRTARRCDRAKG